MAEKLTRDRRRELTRTALLDAAREVFARRGFEGASLEEIAETAGFTRGAIYKNFENKEELFFAVLDRSDEEAFALFAAHIDGEDSPTKYAQVWREELNRDATLSALTLEYRLYALRHPDPAVRERARANRRRHVEHVRAFMEQSLAARGDRSEVTTELAGVILAAADGVVQAALLDPQALDLMEPFFALLINALTTEGVADAAPA